MKIKSKINSKNKTYPFIPLRDQVVFPGVFTPLLIGRALSKRTVELALNRDKMIVVGFQKQENIENPKLSNLHSIATLCYISQLLKLPDNTIRIIVEGYSRVYLEKYSEQNDISLVQSREFEEDTSKPNLHSRSLVKVIKESFVHYAQTQKKIPRDVVDRIEKINSISKLVGEICSNLRLSKEKKIQYIKEANNDLRLENLAVAMQEESEVLDIREGISSKVRSRLEQSQKEFLLNEQLKEIHNELGTDKNANLGGTADLEERLARKTLNTDVRQRVGKEMARLNSLQTASPEFTSLRNYLEWICDLPWDDFTEDRLDLNTAKSILNEDHFGLEEPKNRILDYLAVRCLNKAIKGPIICFIGPPGTGKTSLGRSIAKSLGRRFTRISLGGIRDEAEIRGHRRSYLNALPGTIIQSLRQAKSSNPVMLLDEIDKINSDYRGDPSAALLEVLDPEQNKDFVDHYIEVPVDLSRVLFITTANTIDDIPYPLIDRMEIIEIPGYSLYEKEEILRQYLIPKQLKENGVAKVEIEITKDAAVSIISDYTMESGVRSLERELGKLIRKQIRAQLELRNLRAGNYAKTSAFLHENQEHAQIDYSNNSSLLDDIEDKWSFGIQELKEYLGNPKYELNNLVLSKLAGLVIGMAWTSTGGRILPVESCLIRGKGNLLITGKIGDVMKESAQIAFSIVRNLGPKFAIDNKLIEEHDIHIHIPEGAIPKDGPSAGIALVSAILSIYTGKIVSSKLAMTGEITLSSRIIPVGGVKEKVLAAHRNRIYTVVLPEKNKNDFETLPEQVKKDMQVKYFSYVPEALDFIFNYESSV